MSGSEFKSLAQPEESVKSGAASVDGSGVKLDPGRSLRLKDGRQARRVGIREGSGT